MKLVWSREAVHDLAEARAYIEPDNPAAAARLAKRIKGAVRSLLKNPQLGRKGRLRGTRELIIPRTSYFIPYRIHGDRIQLLRVYHGSRLYPPRN